jgi:acyl carrier protein
MIETVRAFVIENFLFGNGAGLAGNTSFVREGIIDSAGILELVAFLEKTFGIRIEDEELTPENLGSLDALSRFLETKRAA